MDTEKLKETTAKGKRWMTPYLLISVRKKPAPLNGWEGLLQQ
jgi:hypothetical protein